jgi:DNA replication and repair protein RecF
LKLKSIRLFQFRNYPDRDFTFSDSGAILLGPNGSGKTNLFEAIAYNSYGKSFRYHSDHNLLRFDSRVFRIEAEFELLMGNCKIVTEFSTGRKKITINQIPVKQLSQIYEYVKVIYCSPEDIYLVNGSPRKRRQYFDLAIAQMTPSYIMQLRHYIHIVEQRNTLLKDIADKQQKKHWDKLFIDAALPVIAARLAYVDSLNAKIQSRYKNTLVETSGLNIVYKPTLNPVRDEAGPQSYLNDLARLECREWQYQRTLLGPHLDDYDIMLDGRQLAETGSQGQKRTVTLLIKIAHLELIKDSIGEYPILLLDDIFAELDKEHTAHFMQILESHEQVFVASPNTLTAGYWENMPVIGLTSGADSR